MEQLSLFSKEIERKPRPANIPAVPKTKDTQASYSVWGWLFQITAAIVLGLKYRKNMTKIKVEGKTEDIELYFSDRDPIYVQAKSTGKSSEENDNATAHCTAAMNTLINTTNIHKNKYSELIYISNYLNPLKLSEEIWRAMWKPEKTELFLASFEEDIPKEGQEYLLERIKAAQKQLMDGKYLYTTTYFSLKKLNVATLIFSRKNSIGQEENIKECRTLNNLIDKILESDHTGKLRESIEAELYRRYHNNATNFELMIKKEEICGIFIYKIIQEAPETYLEKYVPIFNQREVNTYADDFIVKQSQNIDVINKILSDFLTFDGQKYPTEAEKEEAFLEQESRDKELENYFPLSDNDEIRKECLKYLTYKILYKQQVITQTKKEFNIQ